jgi:hypothetical protein
MKTIKFHLNIHPRFLAFKSAGGYEASECEARGSCALFIGEIRLLSLQSWTQSIIKQTLKTPLPTSSVSNSHKNSLKMCIY